MKENNKELFYVVLAIASAVFVIGFNLGLFFIFNYMNIDQYDGFTPYQATIMVISNSLAFIIMSIEILAAKINPNASKAALLGSIFIFLMAICDNNAYLFYQGIGIPLSDTTYFLFNGLHYCFAILSIYFIIVFFYQYGKIHVDKTELIVSLSLLVASVISFIILNLYHMGYIAIVIIFLLFSYWFIKIVYFFYKKKKFEPVVIFTLIIMASIMTIEFLNSLSYTLALHPVSVSSFVYIVIAIMFASVYVSYMTYVSKKSYEKEEIEKKANQLKVNILAKQSVPHFVFNALNNIKINYAIDTSKGDQSVDLLAKLLRSFAKAGKINLISFKKELDLIFTYIEFINMNSNTPFQVLFNVEIDDFYVPYFAIQTLIENAVKYSGVNSKNDGYIEIRSYKDDNAYYIEVIDNGKGFDLKENNLQGLGIANAKERFEMLLDAKFEIYSKSKEGARIKITIPLEKGEIKDD